MKKGLKVLLLAAVATPFIANADMAAPTFRGYEAVVTKADGIKVCENNNCETMKNGDKFKISFAYDESFETESPNKKTVYTIVYNGKDYADVELAADDFRPYTEEVKVTDSDISKLKTPSKIKILKEVELRKGPGEAYGLVDKIPAGTETTFQYYTSGEDELTHVYVEYNGKGGWIEVLHGSVLFIHDFYSLVFKDIKANNLTIKKGTILKGIGSLDPWSKTNIYNYNGTEISYCSNCDWELSNIYPVYAKALRDIKVYDEPENGKVVKTIKKGEEFISLIFTDEDIGDSAPASYVYYDGIKGYTHYQYDDETYDLLDYEEVPDKKVDYKTIGLEEPKESPYTYLEDDSDLPTPDDKKDDKKDEKKDDKKENNNLYIILGIVIGSVLVVIGFLVGLATKKNKVQEQQQ